MADLHDAVNQNDSEKAPIITVPSDAALLTKRFHRFLQRERERENPPQDAVTYKQQAVRYHTMLLQLVDLQHKHRLEMARVEATRELDKLGVDMTTAGNICTSAKQLAAIVERAVEFEYGDELMEFMLVPRFAHDANLALLLMIFMQSLLIGDGEDEILRPGEMQYVPDLLRLMDAMSRTFVGAEALFKCGFINCIVDGLLYEIRKHENQITYVAVSMMVTMANVFDRVHKSLHILNDTFLNWMWEVAKRYEKMPIGKSENEKRFADALFKCIVIYASDPGTRTAEHGKLFLQKASSLRAAKRSGSWVAERLARMTAGMLDGVQCMELAPEYLKSGMFDFALEEFSKQRGRTWLSDLVSGFSWILKLLLHPKDDAARVLKPMSKPAFQRKVCNLRNVYKEMADKKIDIQLDDDDPELFDSDSVDMLWKIPRNTQAWLDDLRRKDSHLQKEQDKREQARQRQLKCELLLVWLFVVGVGDQGSIDKQELVDSMLAYRGSVGVGDALQRHVAAYQTDITTEADYRRMMESRAKCDQLALLDIALSSARQLTKLNTVLGRPVERSVSIPNEYLDIPSQLEILHNELDERTKKNLGMM